VKAHLTFPLNGGVERGDNVYKLTQTVWQQKKWSTSL